MKDFPFLALNGCLARVFFFYPYDACLAYRFHTKIIGAPTILHKFRTITICSIDTTICKTVLSENSFPETGFQMR